MKLLYALQGTGDGHINRAQDIIPILRKHCETDVLISGCNSDVHLKFDVKYKYLGLSYIFGKKGGIDLWNAYIRSNIKNFFNEIRTLPIKEYDFVINDFEPVSAWACYLNKVPCIALSHQAALLNKNVPGPKRSNPLGKFILRNYAPSNVRFGLHFCKYSKNIFTPVIRRMIREANRIIKDHYIVYIPEYEDKKIVEVLQEIKDVQWQIFSKNAETITINKNIEIYPITEDGFVESMTTSCGVLCSAGFETPAEALFLGKKLMVVPIYNHYEQHYNAESLKAIGVPVIKKLKLKYVEKILDWVFSDYRIEINYPDHTDKLVTMIFESHIQNILKKNRWDKHYNLFISNNKNDRKAIKAFKRKYKTK
jgi:uncharacterized protein (TIGR00661 family)